MKFLKLYKSRKKGLVPFEGSPHVNSQRHLKGAARFFSKREMTKRARYLLSINHVKTGSRFMDPALKDSLDIKRNSSFTSRW